MYRVDPKNRSFVFWGAGRGTDVNNSVVGDAEVRDLASQQNKAFWEVEAVSLDLQFLDSLTPFRLMDRISGILYSIVYCCMCAFHKKTIKD